MKIDLDIDDRYKELEVLIKSRKLDDEVLEIMNKLKEKKVENFLGNKNERIYILKPEDIICFYSDSQKIMVDTEEGSFEIKLKLYEIEEMLINLSFVRVSKFAIVNIEKINNIELSFGGNLIINLVNERKENISRRYIKKVKDFIKMEGK
ncbi:LytTR family DNA-binding domain-containing protein [uncultured Clostridium sp.]|uniref:LytTR family DNA-binding domain-containing protein n=1 Tax=uncultured Clostridium sp. TaxID=59620 RepID=UPI00261B8CFA|nr:LytTR family DNA-binding domain-containing protein [uncultured Clostridium sp.]